MDERSTGHAFVVGFECVLWRLDRFLAARLQTQDVSREKIKKAILAGQCRIDEMVCRDPSFRVVHGQCVALQLTSVATKVVPDAGELAVLFQDAHLAVINKPAGLTVHPCPSCSEGTLVHRLVAHFPSIGEQEGLRPGIVHRLDKDTSGLMVVALTEEARLRLSAAFAGRQVHKEYLALVRGVPAGPGQSDAPIGRDPTVKVRMAVLKQGRPASTSWQVVLADDRSRFSLLRVRIYTGRTHQIRVHLAHEGFALWGDSVYGAGREGDPASRQMLHAWRLAFVHPFTEKRLSFCCPPPADVQQTLEIVDQRMQRVVLTGTPGCGKSTLLKALGELGIPVWSADAAVARLYEPGNEGWQILRQRHGDRFVPDDRSPVDRRILGAAVLESASLRHELEAFVHPLVRHELEHFWADQEAKGAHRAVAEVPLWFETGWKPPEGFSPVVVGVSCRQEDRHARLSGVRKWGADLIAAMDAWQWPEEKKMLGCDLVVPNVGSAQALKEEAQTLCGRLQSLEDERRDEVLLRYRRAVSLEHFTDEVL